MKLMRKRKRLLASLLSLAMLLPVLSVPLPAYADDPPEGMIDISGDWQGSVFGDVGGQDKITAINFGIQENGDGSVTLRSGNDRGKISSSSDGMAYYFKDVPEDADFELSATATVDAWTSNNQVSFGIMLRDEVAMNVSASVYGKTDYVAAGALDQAMKGFTRLGGTQGKVSFANAPAAPATGLTYELSIKKSGNHYTLKVGSEATVIENFAGKVHYAGLFTARNTTVTYSNVNLQVVEPEDPGTWEFRAFGSNTSADKNPLPEIGPDGSVALIAENGGKLASGEEGMSFYYREMPSAANFELSARATVNSFNNTSLNNPDQKAFGIMLKDQVGENGNSAKHASNYAAVGGFGGKNSDPNHMRAFYKNGTQTKLSPFAGVAAPTAGEAYDLKIKKSGDVFVLSVNGESAVVATDPSPFSGDKIYAGLYVAREANITFSHISIKTDDRSPIDLVVDTSNMKMTYLAGEALDTSGLSVKAVYAGGAEENLANWDYAITGFDSSAPGSNTITIHFNGVAESISLQIIALEVTQLTVSYYPAKTDYYIGDTFDPEGLVIEADYNDGYLIKPLTEDLYTLSIAGEVIDSTYVFATAGTVPITVASTETPTMTATFQARVSDASVAALLIKRPPARTQYFIGDLLDLDGLAVYAQYDDNSSVRLMRDEYAVSALDSASAGTKSITVTYRGKSASFEVDVKERISVGLEVTKYPQTSFTVGESFNPSGLEIAKVYDNGDRETVPVDEYEVDANTNFDNTTPGEYEIRIVPDDASLNSISYRVTVREQREHEWKSIRFGQSTSDANNKITVNETDHTVKLEALGGSAGKITGDHDGISFYYTEIDAAEDNFVLSADIKVHEYAKTPSQDGQESFGIMARDAIGTPGDSSVFASNIAAVGGYSGSTTGANGTQLFVRTGVTTPDGSGSQGIQKIMLNDVKPALDNTYPAKPYKLTLAKTNSGFTGRLNDGAEAILYTPDILNAQDGKIYVGFYAARLATIEVSHIRLSVTAARTDPPRVEPPEQATAPDFEIVSLDRTPDTAYRLKVKANVDGALTVKQGQTVISQDVAVKAGQVAAVPATLAMDSRNNFSLAFLPDDTQYLTSYDKIVRNFSVTTKSYAGDIYVSPTGSSGGAGDAASPIDLDTAVSYVKAGQRIIVQAGTYVRHERLVIPQDNDGMPDARKTLMAAPGTRPVIDFDKQTEGVVLSGDYWHVLGLDFTRSADNTKGFTIGGNHNIVENGRFYENGDTGLQISRTFGDANAIEEWPSYNLVLNSTSHDNRDPSNNNADGFAAKLTSGVGNVFRGCISYHNIDDGWDLYTKAGSGAIGPVLIEDSVAYENGTLSNGTVGSGDKNGFKLGGEGIHVAHTIRNSIAFGNGAYGFTSNSNPGVIARNNISFNNAKGNLNFTTYTNIPTDFTLDGFVSYQKDYTAKDSYPASLNSDRNYMFDGTKSANKSGVTITDGNFASLTVSLPFDRDESGRIVLGDFLRFIAPQPDDDGEQGGSGGGPAVGGGDSPVIDGARIMLPTRLNGRTAQGSLTEVDLGKLLANAEADARGVKRVRVQLAPADGAGEYAIALPASSLSGAGDRQRILISTDAAEILLPGNMLDNAGAGDAKELVVRLAKADPAALPADVRSRIGDRPVIELSVAAADGSAVAFNDPDAPVQVSIPYTPTAEELRDPEHITIWYIDGMGNAIAVPTGRYHADTGQVTFMTTHFSTFAVVYVRKSFGDLAKAAWAKKEIEVLASKGVLAGTGEDRFTPGTNVSRADYVIMLVKALGLSAAADSNFADVKQGDYYEKEVGIAKKLGIVSGTGNGRFDPRANVSRQDMFAMTARALRAAGIGGTDRADLSALDGFVDRADLSAYAASDAAAMIQAGIVHGDPQQRLNPRSYATRAEAAVIIYRAYDLQP